MLPVYKRVDTCAAEFATATAYLYSTYEEECEAASHRPARKIMILGGGPNRIGQGIEFDYCCVHAALALREDGFETIMVNCNPETVSTDYDTSDRLYFEPLTLEDVLEIIHKERPEGVIVQFGGQTPLKLARALEAAGAPIIGTTPDSIDIAEDRERFQQLVQAPGAAPAGQCHRAQRGAGGGAGARGGLPAGGAPLLRARRPRHGDRVQRGRPAQLRQQRRKGVQRQSGHIMTISGGSALSKDDIEKMMADAEKYADEDRKRREEAEVRNRAETLTYTTEKFLSENSEKLPEDVTSEVDESIAELKKALEGTDTEAIRTATEKAAQASQKMGTAIYAQAQAESAATRETGAPAGETPDDDEVVEAEIVEDDKPGSGGDTA